MKNLRLTLLPLLALLASPVAFASSHREAPAIANDPTADNTDVYAWVKPGDHSKTYIVANWIPFEEPSGGPNFHKWSDDVQYEIHIARGPGSLDDAVKYTFRFQTQSIPRNDPATHTETQPLAGVGGGKEFFAQLSNPANGGYVIQTYTVTKTVYNGTGAPTVTTISPAAGAISAPPRIGPRTQSTLNAVNPALVTSGTYNDAYAATFIATGTDGTRVFAGPRDDGFYVDLGGIFDLANLRKKAGTGGTPADCARGAACASAQDGVAGFNVHSIALEIPTTLLTSNGAAPATNTASDANTLGIWASSSRKKVAILRRDGSTSYYGPWVQVSRLGLPLINEAVIGIQDKDKFNRSKPKDDGQFFPYFLNPVVVRDAEAVGIYAALGVPVDNTYRYGRTDIIDVINLKAACGAGQTAPCHNIPVAAGTTGDVLRLDLGLDSQFPNGRQIPNAGAANKEQVDVTDVLLTLLLAKPAALAMNGQNGSPPFIQDGVDYNDKPFLTTFPFLALPWQGYDEGHGKTTP